MKLDKKRMYLGTLSMGTVMGNILYSLEEATEEKKKCVEKANKEAVTGATLCSACSRDF